MRSKMRLYSFSDKKGFTLVELLMVIAIIGVLASIAIKQVSEERMKANDAQTITFMRNLLTRAETDLPDEGTAIQLINGGTPLNPSYPEITLSPGMTLLMWYNSDGEARWDFYLGHEGGKLGFYFWLPSDNCTYDLKPPGGSDPAIPSDKLVPSFDTRNAYDFTGYRGMVGL